MLTLILNQIMNLVRMEDKVLEIEEISNYLHKSVQITLLTLIT